MPDTPTKAQLDRAARVVAFEHRDPLTDERHCRWCLFLTPAAHQAGGEYLCPQCLRWQHEKAFPDGVPGLTMDEVTCPSCNHVSQWRADEPTANIRCTNCGRNVHPTLARAAGRAVPEDTDGA